MSGNQQPSSILAPRSSPLLLAENLLKVNNGAWWRALELHPRSLLFLPCRRGWSGQVLLRFLPKVTSPSRGAFQGQGVGETVHFSEEAAHRTPLPSPTARSPFPLLQTRKPEAPSPRSWASPFTRPSALRAGPVPARRAGKGVQLCPPRSGDQPAAPQLSAPRGGTLRTPPRVRLKTGRVEISELRAPPRASPAPGARASPPAGSRAGRAARGRRAGPRRAPIQGSQCGARPARVRGIRGVLSAPQPSSARRWEAEARSALGSQPACRPASPRRASAPLLPRSRLPSRAARRTQPASLSAFTTGSSCGGRERGRRRSGPLAGARPSSRSRLPPPPPLLPIQYN